MTTPHVESQISESAQLLVESLENAWRHYLTELKRCRSEFSNEAVHDLRVAARRMMAVIQLLECVTPRPRLQKIIQTLKQQLDDLDELRDTQVIVAEISETIYELPALGAFQKQQLLFEKKLFRTLRKKIRKSSDHDLSRRIRKTHDSIPVEAEDLKERILQAVDDAYLTTRERLAWVDIARPITIHRVRIAFKKFRYMLELSHPLVEDFPNMNLERMHHYQSLMGDVQDAEVFIETLSDFSERDSVSDLDAVRRYYEQRRSETITAYMQAIHELHTFWRSAPDQPFPWRSINENLFAPSQ